MVLAADTYLDDVRCEHQAYFIGLMLADGSVGAYCGRASMVRLSQKARGYLEDVTQHIGGSVTYRADGNATWCVRSDRLAGALARYGIVPGKTYIGCPFPKVPAHLTSHCVRGFIDGDGWVTHRNMLIRNRYRYTYSYISACGHVDVLTSLRDTVEDALGISGRLRLQTPAGKVVRNPRGSSVAKRDTWVLCYEKKGDVSRLAGWLLEGATLLLPAKLGTLLSQRQPIPETPA